LLAGQVPCVSHAFGGRERSGVLASSETRGAIFGGADIDSPLLRESKESRRVDAVSVACLIR